MERLGWVLARCPVRLEAHVTCDRAGSAAAACSSRVPAPRWKFARRATKRRSPQIPHVLLTPSGTPSTRLCGSIWESYFPVAVRALIQPFTCMALQRPRYNSRPYFLFIYVYSFEHFPSRRQLMCLISVKGKIWCDCRLHFSSSSHLSCGERTKEGPPSLSVPFCLPPLLWWHLHVSQIKPAIYMGALLTSGHVHLFIGTVIYWLCVPRGDAFKSLFHAG